MQVHKGGSSLQHQALPKAQVGDISRLFYEMKRAHGIPRDVIKNGGFGTS
jgi:hypothetical protein